MEISPGDVIAALALLLSGYAIWKAHKFRESEKELLELQKKVNSLVLDKEQREAIQAKSADLGANFIPIGSKNHRLKVFNKGQAAAYQVNIDFPEGNKVIPEWDVQEKFPLEVMDRGQSVELIAEVTLRTRGKLAVRLSWQNEEGETYEKKVYVTL